MSNNETDKQSRSHGKRAVPIHCLESVPKGAIPSATF